MPKDFWIKCIKRFLSFSIPSLITVITVFTLFSSQFENSLKNFGVFGAIIVCLLCFCLTLLYGIFEMEKVVHFVGSECAQDPDFDITIIYKSFNLNQNNRKNQKNYNKITVKDSTFDAINISFSNKYLRIEEMFADALQEISFIAMACAFTSMSVIFQTPVIGDVPQSLTDANILEIRKSISKGQKYNVIVDFYGIIKGSVLLCFSQIFENYVNNMIQNEYPKYINHFSIFTESFLYEIGSIFTGMCLTNLYGLDNQAHPLSWDERNQKVLNFNIITNININYLKVHNNTENLYVVKMNGNVNEGNLFTSYILLGKEDAERLVKNCMYKIT